MQVFLSRYTESNGENSRFLGIEVKIVMDMAPHHSLLLAGLPQALDKRLASLPRDGLNRSYTPDEVYLTVDRKVTCSRTDNSKAFEYTRDELLKLMNSTAFDSEWVFILDSGTYVARRVFEHSVD